MGKQLLTLTKIPGTMNWIVSEDYSFMVDRGNHRYFHAIIEEESGFRTDLASVPRIFWSFFPPCGVYTEAAVEHDFLYEKALLPRKECDKHFYKRLRELGTGRVGSWLMYNSVRLFGKGRYND